MNELLKIDYQYDELTFLDQLQAYNCNVGVNSLLDLAREIQTSGNYYWSGLAFPDLAVQNTVPAQATISGTKSVPPGTYITQISCYSQLGAGFNLKIYDKGTKASIFYGDYAQNSVVGGVFDSGYGLTPNVPTGSGFLKSPFIITGPGVIGWEIVNLSPSANRIQVMLELAVPITVRSIQNVVVSRG